MRHSFIYTFSRFFFLFIIMSNNASSSLFNTVPTPKIHVILNIISLIATALGTLISFMILVGLLLRKKTLHDVPLLLCTNNYVVVFLLGIFEFMHNLNTLQGDFGLWIIDHNILLCQIQAYIVFSFISAVYLACVLQVSLKRTDKHSLNTSQLY
jgi:hypothetical protein